MGLESLGGGGESLDGTGESLLAVQWESWAGEVKSPPKLQERLQESLEVRNEQKVPKNMSVHKEL